MDLCVLYCHLYHRPVVIKHQNGQSIINISVGLQIEFSTIHRKAFTELRSFAPIHQLDMTRHHFSQSTYHQMTHPVEEKKLTIKYFTTYWIGKNVNVKCEITVIEKEQLCVSLMPMGCCVMQNVVHNKFNL